MDYQLSRWNGWNGNECVFKKDYDKAIEFYTTAIRLYPLEYRYFVNRSFCYDRLKQFDLALEDAQTAVGLHEQRAKCYFRKARALKGLERLEEAEMCFWKVIQLEGNHCIEAHIEIKQLKQMARTEQNESVSVTSGESVDTINSSQSTDTKSNSISSKHKTKKINRICNTSSYNGSEKPSENTQTSGSGTDAGPDIVLNTVKSIGHSCAQTESQVDVTSGFRCEKNILKELSDFLLNENVLKNVVYQRPLCSSANAEIKNKFELKSTVEEYSNFTMSAKMNEKNGQKNRSNYKNVHKGLDEIVEIWDDPEANYWSFPIKRNSNKLKNEPTNLWKFRGLHVLNIRPTEVAIEALRKKMSEFGKVSHASLVPKTTAAIVNFDNPESPRMAMAKLQGVHIRDICLSNQKLKLYFRPLNDSPNYPSISSAADRQLNNECYFWRTTGCNKSCKLKHIAANKGVDLQPWMQLKSRYKQPREFRHRFDTM